MTKGPMIGVHQKTGFIVGPYIGTKALEEAGFTSSNVYRACRGNLRTSAGYYWKRLPKPPRTHKDCPICKQRLPVEKFFKNGCNLAGEYYYKKECRACWREHIYMPNRDKYIEAQKRRAENMTEEQKARRRQQQKAYRMRKILREVNNG